MYDGAAMSVAVVSPRHVSGTFVRICSAVLALALVSACASTHRGSGVAQRGIYKIGAPYSIDGITYYPQEEFQHVETGVASWYGPGFHGKSTANGERYDQQEHTAAHRTLQMPSVVRVTNLDNGLSTVVRVNDRGPYARNRVLDVSRAAAQELDMMKSGTARVRIEQLTTESQVVKEVALNGGGPSEQRDAIAKYVAGRRGPPSITATAQATPPPVVQVQAAVPNNPRSPAVTPMQVSGAAGNSGPSIASLAVATPQPAGGFYVQTGSFSTADNAERQRGLVRSYGLSEISQASAAGRDVFRVRLGPYTTSDAAGIVADRLKRSGYGDARVVVE
jgi:rare lipoprotein A